MLSDTVTLFNYTGEVDDIATYQETILRHCYCEIEEGISNNSRTNQQHADSALLFIFDEKTVAESLLGTKRIYVPYGDWLTIADKNAYWTISDSGKDFFRKAGSDVRLRIVKFSHMTAGRKRMWHFEVIGK